MSPKTTHFALLKGGGGGKSAGACRGMQGHAGACRGQHEGRGFHRAGARGQPPLGGAPRAHSDPKRPQTPKKERPIKWAAKTFTRRI